MKGSKSDEDIHGTILRNTSIIGGASAVTMVLGIIRNKVAAVLLGTTGVGTLGLFTSAISLAQTVSQLGINISAVRCIADAHAAGDTQRIGRITTAVRSTVLVLGLFCSVIFFLFRREISIATFGDDQQASAMAWLALIPLMTAIAGGHQALIRGTRRVGDLARVNVFGGLLGLVLGLPLLFLLRVNGLAAYLIALSASTIGLTWWFARKIPLPQTSLDIGSIARESRNMVTMGAVLMAAEFAGLAAIAIARSLLGRQLGLDVVGLFEASNQIANVYIGFVLGAISADFFPQLVGAAKDDALSSRLINAQAEIGVLIATPAILFVISVGPFLLHLLYSSSFAPAFEILRWQALGTFLRLLTWPIGFLLLSRGRKGAFLGSQTIIYAFYLGLLWLGTNHWGIKAVGPAFFAMYAVHALINTALARNLIGFRWCPKIFRLLAVASSAVLLTLGATYVLPPLPMTVAGLLVTSVTAAFAFNRLYRIMGSARIRRRFAALPLLARFFQKPA